MVPVDLGEYFQKDFEDDQGKLLHGHVTFPRSAIEHPSWAAGAEVNYKGFTNLSGRARERSDYGSFAILIRKEGHILQVFINAPLMAAQQSATEKFP